MRSHSGFFWWPLKLPAILRRFYRIKGTARDSFPERNLVDSRHVRWVRHMAGANQTAASPAPVSAADRAPATVTATSIRSIKSGCPTSARRRGAPEELHQQAPHFRPPPTSSAVRGPQPASAQRIIFASMRLPRPIPCPFGEIAFPRGRMAGGRSRWSA